MIVGIANAGDLAIISSRIDGRYARDVSIAIVRKRYRTSILHSGKSVDDESAVAYDRDLASLRATIISKRRRTTPIDGDRLRIDRTSIRSTGIGTVEGITGSSRHLTGLYEDDIVSARVHDFVGRGHAPIIVLRQIAAPDRVSANRYGDGDRRGSDALRRRDRNAADRNAVIRLGIAMVNAIRVDEPGKQSFDLEAHHKGRAFRKSGNFAGGNNSRKIKFCVGRCAIVHVGDAEDVNAADRISCDTRVARCADKSIVVGVSAVGAVFDLEGHPILSGVFDAVRCRGSGKRVVMIGVHISFAVTEAKELDGVCRDRDRLTTDARRNGRGKDQIHCVCKSQGRGTVGIRRAVDAAVVAVRPSDGQDLLLDRIRLRRGRDRVVGVAIGYGRRGTTRIRSGIIGISQAERIARIDARRAAARRNAGCVADRHRMAVAVVDDGEIAVRVAGERPRELDRLGGDVAGGGAGQDGSTVGRRRVVGVRKGVGDRLARADVGVVVDLARHAEGQNGIAARKSAEGDVGSDVRGVVDFGSARRGDLLGLDHKGRVGRRDGVVLVVDRICRDAYRVSSGVSRPIVLGLRLVRTGGRRGGKRRRRNVRAGKGHRNDVVLYNVREIQRHALLACVVNERRIVGEGRRDRTLGDRDACRRIGQNVVVVGGNDRNGIRADRSGRGRQSTRRHAVSGLAGGIRLAVARRAATRRLAGPSGSHRTGVAVVNRAEGRIAARRACRRPSSRDRLCVDRKGIGDVRREGVIGAVAASRNAADLHGICQSTGVSGSIGSAIGLIDNRNRRRAALCGLRDVDCHAISRDHSADRHGSTVRRCVVSPFAILIGKADSQRFSGDRTVCDGSMDQRIVGSQAAARTVAKRAEYDSSGSDRLVVAGIGRADGNRLAVDTGSDRSNVAVKGRCHTACFVTLEVVSAVIRTATGVGITVDRRINEGDRLSGDAPTSGRRAARHIVSTERLSRCNGSIGRGSEVSAATIGDHGG